MTYNNFLRRVKGYSGKILTFAAILSLVAAYVYGCAGMDRHIQAKLYEVYQDKSTLEKVSTRPLIYKKTGADGAAESYIAVNKEQGWGGPFHIATEVDPSGVISGVHVLEHRETPSFFMRLDNNKFFTQFQGKKVLDDFIPGSDVDVVTRATISSKGFTKGIREGSHSIASKVMNLTLSDRTVSWKFGKEELILIVLYSLAIIGVFRKIPALRNVTMAAGIVFLGFYLSFPVSISQISSLMLGFVPAFKENIFWWLLVPGTLILTFILGKNIYCYWLCPFGALQEFLGRVSGITLKVHRRVASGAKYLTYFLTWLSLFVIFLSSNPAMGSYEPFGAIFGFEGYGVMWYILPVVLFSSFFIRRFWCRFFCPVGTVLNGSCRVRNGIKKRGLSR